MRTALAAFLVVLCSLWAAAAAVADPVTVRVKSNDGSYSYVTRDLPASSCEVWTIDFRRDDGTIWGSESGPDRAGVEDRAAKYNNFLSWMDNLGKSKSKEHYNNPSPAYCSVFSSDTAMLDKLRGDGEVNFPFKTLAKAQNEVLERIRNYVAGARTYYEQFKAAPGRSFMEYGRVLADGMAKTQKIEQELLTPALRLPFEVMNPDGFAPFLTGIDEEGVTWMRSWARAVRAEEPRIQQGIRTIQQVMRDNQKDARENSREYDAAVARIERLRRDIRNARDPRMIDILERDLARAEEKRDYAMERQWSFDEQREANEERIRNLRERELEVPEKLSFILQFSYSCGCALEVSEVFEDGDREGDGVERLSDRCSVCGGSGKVDVMENGELWRDYIKRIPISARPPARRITCPECGGTGKR